MNLKIKKGDILSPTESMNEVDAITVFSDEGTPLFTILQHGGGVFLKTAEEEDFQEVLEKLQFV
jgi:hypothetical protein